MTRPRDPLADLVLCYRCGQWGVFGPGWSVSPKRPTCPRCSTLSVGLPTPPTTQPVELPVEEHQHQWSLLPTSYGWKVVGASRSYSGHWGRDAEWACPCGAFQTTSQRAGPYYLGRRPEVLTIKPGVVVTEALAP